MATDREQLDVNIPSAANAVVAEFRDRDQADAAVDMLTKKGYGADRISLVARGAGVYDGVFQPGILMITVHADGKDDEVTMLLRDAGAHDVRHGAVSATGDVKELEEREKTSTA